MSDKIPFGEWPQEAREVWVRWYQSVPPQIVAGARQDTNKAPATVPEHMRDDAEYYEHWHPEHYEEAQCENCDEPVYRYRMDLVVEWKHFNHATYCSTLRARPKPSS